MIELIDVSKFYVTEIGRHYVFRDVSLRLPFDKSVAVIGPNGAGKSTFMRLLGGADVPSEGRIIRTGRISPPMGLTPGLQSSLSAAENARFAGRIYGLMRDEINDLIDHVRETADIGKFFDLPVSSYSAGMKQRVAFAINMSLDFDYYLFDEIAAGGDREFRKYSKAKVQERLATSKFIIASHRSDELLDLCDAGIVIKDGELTFFDDVKDALAAYSVDDDMEGDELPRGRRRRNATEDDEAGTDRKSRKDKILEREARREEKRKARAAEAAEQDAVDAEPLEEAELEAAADAAELAGDDIEHREEQPDERTTDGGEDTGRAANRKSRKDKILERQARREEKRKARAAEAAEQDAVDAEPLEEAELEAIADTAELAGDDIERREEQPDERTADGGEDTGRAANRKSRKDKILERQARREEKRKARAAEAAEQDAVDAEPLEEAELEAAADAAELAGDDIEHREEQPDERMADGGEDTGRAANRKSRKDKILERQARREEKRKARGTETAVTDPVASAPPETEDNDEATGPERSPEATPVVFLAADTEPQKDFSKPSSIEHLAPRLEFRRQPKTHELAGVGDAEDVSDLNAEYDSKRVLRLALLRQERAQVKSARALRLLLQHLDHQSENRESATWSARATIVAAAQESAASESAQARSLLHVRAPGGKSSAPESNHPSGSPLLTPGPETSRNSPDF